MANDHNEEEKDGGKSLAGRITLFMSLWYACSGVTLFGNKHIMNTLGCDPNVLAMTQMVSTFFFGALKMYGPYLFGGRLQSSPLSSQPLRSFITDMAIVGLMRFATVMLGLVSLKFVAVSFTETVKSSAPFFTVIFAQLILGERTSFMVKLSLLPVVGGLALCSATELSFNYIGFFAAVFNNCARGRQENTLAAVVIVASLVSRHIFMLHRCTDTQHSRTFPILTCCSLHPSRCTTGIDCVQNVFSKKLLTTHYNYINLQFYTSAAALLIQLPLMLYKHFGAWLRQEHTFSAELALCLLLNGMAFHLQSVMAYAVMGLISPVSQSVANTLKRALLIFLSILYFGNPVTWLSAIGTATCIGGVFAYNHARREYPYRPPALLPWPSGNNPGKESVPLLRSKS